MRDIILNYIIQAILGGASGYITNDYAINMLFKEYTPLKVGGVIKKTRTEFIDKISSMVENDIINKDKLNDILQNDDFNEKFEQLILDFYKNCLYISVGTMTVSDLSGWDNTLLQTKTMLQEKINPHIKDLVSIFFENIQKENILTDIQLNHISKELFESVIGQIKNNGLIEELLFNIYTNSKNIKPIDIISGLEDKTKLTLSRITEQIYIEFKSNILENSIIDNLLTILEIDEVLLKTSEVFYNERIETIFKIDEKCKFKLSEELKYFVNSHEGHSLINNICINLIDVFKKCDLKVYDILNPSFADALKEYLIITINHAVELINTWIDNNEENIILLVEESINEIIKESEGLKGILLNTIKIKYFENKKQNIPDIIKDYVSKTANPEQLGKNFAEKTIKFLKNLTFGDIVTELLNYNLITLEILKGLIIEYVNENSENIIEKLTDYIMNLQVKSLVPKSNINFREFILNNVITLFDSDKINNYIYELINNNIFSLINKELETLNEQSAKNVIMNIEKFLINKAIENPSILKHYINKEIYNTFNIDKLKDLELLNMVNNELNNIYNQATLNIKGLKLYEILDRINASDTIYSNSSELLRNYSINKMDNILTGSIKSIVDENLNKLSDDELIYFAHDFVGRELKPIMYFGGVLGILAGILLAAMQNSPADFSSIKIESMITYAIVGLATNAIAIRMIFKPYKEIKFLSKIPFLRNFAQGYIVKNQKDFAKTTAKVIDKTLLNKNSINELFDKYEFSIKNSFAKFISLNNFQLLNNLIDKNRKNIFKNFYQYLNNLIINYKTKIANYVYKKLNTVKLSNILPGSVKSFLKSSTIFKQKITLQLINFLKSHSKIINLFPDKLIEKIKFYSNKIAKNQYKKLSSNLNYNNFKNVVLKFDNSFEDLISNPIESIFSQEQIEVFNQTILKKFNEFTASEETKTILYNKLYSFILNQNEINIEGMFGEKVKKLLYNSELFDGIIKFLNQKIINSKGAVTINIQKEIKNNLGMLERGMYTLIGGDEILDELIYKIIVINVPKFLDEKKDELKDIIMDFSERNILKAKLTFVTDNINFIQIQKLINSFIDSNSETINNISTNIIETMVSKLIKANFKEILNLISYDNLNNITDLYEKEINIFINELSLKVNDKEEQILNIFESLINRTIDSFIKKNSLGDLFKEFKSEDIDLLINNIYNILLHEDIYNGLFKIIEEKYIEYISNENLGKFLCEEEFIKFTENLLINLIESDKTKDLLNEIYESIFEESINDSFNYIDNDFKDALLKIFVDASINSIRRNLNEILKAIEFDQLAREQIESMSPDKIHDMFNSFAGKYFKRLIIYGFGGFVFGINIITGLTLTILKIIKETFTNNETKEKL